MARPGGGSLGPSSVLRMGACCSSDRSARLSLARSARRASVACAACPATDRWRLSFFVFAGISNFPPCVSGILNSFSLRWPRHWELLEERESECTSSTRRCSERKARPLRARATPAAPHRDPRRMVLETWFSEFKISAHVPDPGVDAGQNPGPRWAHTFTALHELGEAYVLGGIRSAQNLSALDDSVWCLNLRTLRWEELAPQPETEEGV